MCLAEERRQNMTVEPSDGCRCTRGCESGVSRHYSWFESVRYLGIDETNGRHAKVELLQCKTCGRLWVRYAVEYPAFSQSGRWAEGVIDEETAAKIMPTEVPEYLAGLEWGIYGGCYYRTPAQRGTLKLYWDC